MNKTNKKRLAFLSATLLTLLCTILNSAEARDGIVVLITKKEAAQPDQKTGGMKMSRTIEHSEGPFVEFLKPTDGAVVPEPVAIHITFKQNQAPVDINSLEVTYLKLFSIDITDRIKPYVTPTGIKIDKAELPTGEHRVKFSIKDTANNLTERTLSVEITDDEEG